MKYFQKRFGAEQEYIGVFDVRVKGTVDCIDPNLVFQNIAAALYVFNDKKQELIKSALGIYEIVDLLLAVEN